MKLPPLKLIALGMWAVKKDILKMGWSIAVLLLALAGVSILLGFIDVKLAVMPYFWWLYSNLATQDAQRGKVKLLTLVAFVIWWNVLANTVFVALISTLTLWYLVKKYLSKRGLFRTRQLRELFAFGLADVFGVPIAFAALAYLNPLALAAGALTFALVMAKRMMFHRREELGIRLLPVCFLALTVGLLCAIAVLWSGL